MPSEDVKIIVVGDSNVGKSSLLTRLAGEEFDEALGNTIAVEYYHRDWKARRKDVHLQFWDTAGQERFRNIIPRYYSEAHVALAVFDLTSKASFDSLEFWIQELRRYAPSDCVVILVGNKADLGEKREVTPKDRLPWPTTSGTKHPRIIEVSAKSLKKPNSLLDTIAAEALTVKTQRLQKQAAEEKEIERMQLYGEHAESPPLRRRRFLFCKSSRQQR